MGTFVCTICGNEVKSRYDQFAERLEVRRVDGKERPIVRTLRLVGRCCLDTLRTTEHADQETLAL